MLRVGSIHKTRKEAANLLREGNLAECDRLYCAALGELRDSPYHQVMDLQFTNSPSLLAAHFDDCVSVNHDNLGLEQHVRPDLRR